MPARQNRQYTFMLMDVSLWVYGRTPDVLEGQGHYIAFEIKSIKISWNLTRCYNKKLTIERELVEQHSQKSMV